MLRGVDTRAPRVVYACSCTARKYGWGVSSVGTGRLTALVATVVGAVAVMVIAHVGNGQAAQAVASARPTYVRQSYTPPDGGNKNRKLVFQANFNGNKLNPNIWATCFYYATGNSCGHYSGHEYQWYMPSQVKVSGGLLHLVAQRKPVLGAGPKGKPEEYYCRSGMATTLPGFNFEYGDVQVVAKIPYAPGLWSAIWLGATNHQWPPEIDMLEHWNTTDKYYSNFHAVSQTEVHGKKYWAGTAFSFSPNLSHGWHTFGLYWSPTSLVWYIDGKKMMSESNHIPHQKMYLILNLAEYTNPKNFAVTCNGSLLVKSVRVWQP